MEDNWRSWKIGPRRSDQTEWITLTEGLDQVADCTGDNNSARRSIGEWIRLGKLTVSAAKLSRDPPLGNEWLEDFSWQDAVDAGFSLPVDGLRYPILLRLKDDFWRMGTDWDRDFDHWNWIEGTLQVSTEDQSDCPTTWSVKQAKLNQADLTVLVNRLLEEMQQKASLPRTRTRRPDPRRNTWTAEIAAMAFEGSIPNDVSANNLISLSVERLVRRGVWGESVEPLDRSTLYAAAQAIVDRLTLLHSEKSLKRTDENADFEQRT